MAEDLSRAGAVIAAAREKADAAPDGRLPLTEAVTREIFPYEGDLRIKEILDPVLPEPPRSGAGGVGCRLCERGTSDVLWTDGTWRVRTIDGPEAVLCVFLEPLAHLDLTDLDDVGAADLGVLTVRVARAIEQLPGVGRVHVYRFGDGVEHLHIWFCARPAGLLQLRGSGLVDWLDALPPMLPELWEADRAALRVALADLRARPPA